MGASRTTLKDIYYKQIRSVLEFASVVWTAGLTQEDISKIERVQKSACSVMLGSEYKRYEDALVDLQMETLTQRRKELALRFAKKASKHTHHQNWFSKNPIDNHTRLKKKPTYNPVCYRTQRFLNSAIPFLTNLLNEEKA